MADEIEVKPGEKEQADVRDIIVDALATAESDSSAIRMIQQILPDNPDVIDLFVLQLGLALCQKFYQQLRNLTKGGKERVKKFHMPEHGDYKH